MHCRANVRGMELWNKDALVFVIFTSALGTCQPAVQLEFGGWGGAKWSERETDNLRLPSTYMKGTVIFIRAYFVTIFCCVELI